MPAKPIKLAVLFDEPRAAEPSSLLNGMNLRLEAFNAAGGVEGRGVELVVEASDGAHGGLPENLVASYRNLVDDPEIVGIIGPGVTDNCLVLVDEVDRARVPTLCWPGSEDCRGEWYFQYQIGSFADETLFLARAMAKAGHSRIAVVQVGTTGMHYFRHFEREARFLDLMIVGKAYANVHQTDVTEIIEQLRTTAPDAILFLGMGAPTHAVATTPRRLGWNVPRYGNLAFLGIARVPSDRLADFEGAIWVDQYEPANKTLQAFEAKYRDRYGVEPSPTPLPAGGWDMITLMCEGLLRGPNLSRAGLKEGLENVKQIPAAMGGAAPTMGFCKWDRQALKGPDILMYRCVRDGVVQTYHP